MTDSVTEKCNTANHRIRLCQMRSGQRNQNVSTPHMVFTGQAQERRINKLSLRQINVTETDIGDFYDRNTGLLKVGTLKGIARNDFCHISKVDRCSAAIHERPASSNAVTFSEMRSSNFLASAFRTSSSSFSSSSRSANSKSSAACSATPT